MKATKTKRGRRHAPPASSALQLVEKAIAEAGGMNLAHLRHEWETRFRQPAPRCRSKVVIRGLLAWRIQAQAFGGLSAETARHLRRIAANHDNKEGVRPSARSRSRLKPGTLLTREWRGALHKVQVLDFGFAHAGRTYRSLSEIARAITGARWSGPRFFGLVDGTTVQKEQP